MLLLACAQASLAAAAKATQLKVKVKVTAMITTAVQLPGAQAAAARKRSENSNQNLTELQHIAQQKLTKHAHPHTHTQTPTHTWQVSLLLNELTSKCIWHRRQQPTATAGSAAGQKKKIESEQMMWQNGAKVIQIEKAEVSALQTCGTDYKMPVRSTREEQKWQREGEAAPPGHI